MRRLHAIAIPLSIICLPWALSAQTVSASRAKAQHVLERLTGVKWPGDTQLISDMAALMDQGKDLEAAQIATGQASFYNMTVRQMALQMSTREETLRTPLNDFVTSFIGVTRDQRDARELLSGNFFYMGDVNKMPGLTIPSDIGPDLLASTKHFDALQAQNVDLSAVLMRVEGQKLVINNANAVVDNPDPAGILTSRAFIKAHADAGTNRRLVEFTMREFACLAIEEWADASSSDQRIGRDVDRFPGGSHQTFQNTCKACHTGMDGFRGAFARWEFRSDIAVNAMVDGIEKAKSDADASKVTRKMNKNNTVFPGGYVTTDDSWVNNAIGVANQSLFGWRKSDAADSDKGNGVASFGRAVANSARFSQCMAQRVFKTVCKKEVTAEKLGLIAYRLGVDFEQNKYNLKHLFEITAIDKDCQP